MEKATVTETRYNQLYGKGTEGKMQSVDGGLSSLLTCIIYCFGVPMLLMTFLGTG
jgi:hypothetical protein